MKGKIFFVFLLLFISSVLFAESSVGVNIGYGQTYLDSREALSFGERATHIELDYSYILNKNFSAYLRGDVALSTRSTLSGKKYEPQIGYGVKGGVNLTLSFLRLGSGVRYQISRCGYSGGEMSLRSLYITMNADILITIGEKSSFVFGIEYDYPLHVKIYDGATETRLTLKNTFFYTGTAYYYGGYMLKF